MADVPRITQERLRQTKCLETLKALVVPDTIRLRLSPAIFLRQFFTVL